MTYQLTTYSVARKLNESLTVVIHFSASRPMHAMVYAEEASGAVHDVWCGIYDGVSEVWDDVVDRLVFGLNDRRPHL